MFDKAAATAIAYSRSLDAGRPSRVLRTRHALYDRLVYSRMRAALGGRCSYAVSGGAPLGERLAHFYRGIGVTVLEGYGLTETTAAVTVNRPEAQRIGTVGQPLGGTTVRLADDGEVLVRGGQVMAGYWQDSAATGSVLDEAGWLHTGDLGEIDDEGFLRVTGRKKEILVTAGGKNVAPAPLEERIRGASAGQPVPRRRRRTSVSSLPSSPWSPKQSGCGRRRIGKPFDLADLVTDEDLLAEIQSAVDDANALVSQAESVRRFAVLPGDWTEEAGQLTPSLKLRRGHVEKLVSGEIERLVPRLTVGTRAGNRHFLSNFRDASRRMYNP